MTRMRDILSASLTFLCLLSFPASAAYLCDFGPPGSALWEDFTRVTAQSVFTNGADFGWQTSIGLKAQARAYTNLVENRGRGRDEPPPIWTNPITEDGISSERTNTFLLRAEPGEYEVYVICGTSDPTRDFFDFTVQVGRAQQRVQMEGGHQFRALRFHTTVGREALAVKFVPRNRWLANAIAAWPVSDSARMQKEFVEPFEQATFIMPASEWAKWKQDPEPETGPMPSLSKSDQQRGFAIYSRHYLECVYPHTKPRAEELNPELKLFASPGEYEPANFIVLPLKNLEHAKVSVTALGPIKASDIDIRHVKFTRARPNYTVRNRWRWVPDALEHFDELELKTDENARFWITVHVPTTAAPGTYRGKIRFTCDRGGADVPIMLRVLPIQLREDPSKLFGIYYRHPYDQMAREADDISRAYFRRKAELEFADMVAHGTRNVTLSCYSSPADAQGNFKVNWDSLAEKFELWKEFDFRGPVVMSISTEGVYRKHVGESFGVHLRNIKDPPESFGAEMTAMVKFIDAERKRRNWPEFLYYPIDEPSREPAAVNFMTKVLKACKAAGVRTYVTADPTHKEFEPMRPYIDVWSTQPFLPERETILADMQARGVEYWCYPNHVNGENDHTPVAGARMTYGFGFWRSGFLTLIPWIYSWTVGDPNNYLDGSMSDFFNRHGPDGTPVPVAMWEAYREGYDDYRYIYTLEQLVREAKQSNRAKAHDVATKAERELQTVWNSIRVQPKYKDQNLWPAAEFDAQRWSTAQQIIAVQNAMK